MPRLKRQIKLWVAGRLERLVQQLLARNPQLKLVAVGGSVGKTSTKLAIAATLSQKYRVQHHEGNYNDPISVPLWILGQDVPSLYNPFVWIKTYTAARKVTKMSYPYDVILVELGTDQPGDMPHFMKFLKPDIGVVTATTPEHMENFRSAEAVIKEEMALARGAKVAILNVDDEGIKASIDKLNQTVTFGKGGTIKMGDFGRSAHGTITGKIELGTDSIAVATNVIAEHSLYAILAATAVGLQLGLSHAEIISGIAAFKPVAGRMASIRGLNASLILDDSYNSSPDAAIAALKALSDIAKGRQIAVLGSMNELGDYAQEGHQRVGAACGNLDLLVTIGRQAEEFIAPAAKNAGLKPDQIKSFDSPVAAGKFVQSLLKTGDTVLVKGSQNRVFAEEATAQLLADPADRSKLVRQTPYWQAIKRAQFKDYE